MGHALRKIEPEFRSYSERIRELVEADKVGGARRLLAEALEGHHNEDLSGWQKVLAKTKGRPNPAVELDVDRTPEFLWITEHSDAYRGQWVALLGSELLAHSTSFKEVVGALERNKPPRRAMLHFIELNRFTSAPTSTFQDYSAQPS